MKKLFFILCVFAFAVCKSQTGAASASLQTIQTNTLARILTAVQNNSAVVVSPAGGALTLSTPTAATSAGTVATGARSITFVTSNNFVGSINTQSYSPSNTITFGAVSSYTYPAVPYTITTGTLYIQPIR